VAGAELFAQSCTTCHTYLGAGSSNQGAPDLSAIGASGQGVNFFERYVSDPSQFGNTIMPKFGEQLSKEQIHQIAVFLDASKGAK
jgi:mono/diheme cytochrome c family protein